MPEEQAGDTSIINADPGAGAHVDTGSIPADTGTQLTEAQQAFQSYFKDNETMKDFMNSEDPFKAVAEKMSTMGQQVSLKVPGEGATAEELSAWRKAIGAFDSIDEYKYEPPTTEDEALKKLLPTEMPFADAFRELALKNNLPASAWKDFTDAYNQMVLEDVKIGAEIQQKAFGAVKENWAKAHGANAPEVEKVFMKYFSAADAAETQILQSLTQEQLAALGSVVYKQDRHMNSEDTIDTKQIGSTTLSDTEYVIEMSKLKAQERNLVNEGKGWSPDLKDVQNKIKELSDRFANQGR